MPNFQTHHEILFKLKLLNQNLNTEEETDVDIVDSVMTSKTNKMWMSRMKLLTSW